MPKIFDIALFLLGNLVGFYTLPVSYYLFVSLNALGTEDFNIDPADFNGYFLHGTYMTWIVCAVFSLSFFFIKGKARYAFLLTPVFVPFFYGLKSLADLFG